VDLKIRSFEQYGSRAGKGMLMAKRTFAVLTVGLALLFPSAVLAQVPSVTAESHPSTRHTKNWAALPTQQKRMVGEAIGERGADRFARARGYKPLLTYKQKTYRHGYDQVWYDPSTKEIVAIEAKGGSGQLRGRQGTSDDVVAAAKKMMRSAFSSTREKKVAQMVLEYAAEGRLRVESIATPHKKGLALQPKLLRVEKINPAAQENAKQALELEQLFGRLPMGKRVPPSVIERAIGESARVGTTWTGAQKGLGGRYRTAHRNLPVEATDAPLRRPHGAARMAHRTAKKAGGAVRRGPSKLSHAFSRKLNRATGDGSPRACLNRSAARAIDAGQTTRARFDAARTTARGVRRSRHGVPRALEGLACGASGEASAAGPSLWGGVTGAGRVTRSVRAPTPVLKSASKAALSAAVVADVGFGVYNAWKIEQRRRKGQISEGQAAIQHLDNVAMTTGGAAGGWAGAKGGALAGAALGSAFGPAGTAVGAVGGAIIGGVAGSGLGGWIGKKASRMFSNWMLH